MSPALPVVSGAEVLRALGRGGFTQVSQKGSHVKLRKESPTGSLTAIVPMHDELAPGTLRSILRQAGLTVDDLLRLLAQ